MHDDVEEEEAASARRIVPPLPTRGAANISALTRISIVIPTYNEGERIRATITAALTRDSHVEVIVVDGGSTDGTRDIATHAGAHAVVVGPPTGGRAACQNAGADSATGDILLFLHGDTLLPDDYGSLVRTALADPTIAMTAFELTLYPRLFGIGLVELGANMRSRYRQLPYGDQALCMRRETFMALGKFPAQTMLEDLELVYTFRRRNGGTKIVTLPACVTSSSRRWMIHGVIGNTLRNQLVLIGYAVGVPLPRITMWYYGHGGLKKY